MNEETPVETPETPETPVETPETPVETPVETPETPVETPELFADSACVSSFEPGALMSALREMIGTPSCGFEYLEYGVAGAIFIILFSVIVSVFNSFSKLLGAR